MIWDFTVSRNFRNFIVLIFPTWKINKLDLKGNPLRKWYLEYMLPVFYAKNLTLKK